MLPVGIRRDGLGAIVGDGELDIAKAEIIGEIGEGRILGLHEDIDHHLFREAVDVSILLDTSSKFVAVE